MMQVAFWLDVWTWVTAGITSAWCFSTNVTRWWFWLPILDGGLLACSFVVIKFTGLMAMFSETMAKAVRYFSIFVAIATFGVCAFYGIGFYMVISWCGGPEGAGSLGEEGKCKFYPHYVQVILLVLLILSNLLVAYYSLRSACLFMDCCGGSKDDEKKQSDSGDSGDPYSEESDDDDDYDYDDDD